MRFGRAYPMNRVLAPTAPAPVIYDTTATGTSALSTSGSWTHAPTAGAGVLAYVVTVAGATVTSATYADTAMTSLGSIALNNAPSNGAVTLFWMPNVPSGAATIAITMSSSHSFTANSVSYMNVGAVGVPVSAFGSSALASLTATCGTGAMIVCGLGAGNRAFTATSGGTQRFSTSRGGVAGIAILDSAASTTFTATPSASDVWAASSVVLIPRAIPSN